MPVEQPTFTAEEIASEVWKDIPGYEGDYQASTLGRIKSMKTYNGLEAGRILKFGRLSRGRRRYKVSLCHRGIEKYWLVHQLIALTFLGPCPEGMECNHKDGNPLNCRADNLEYLTPEENREHAKANGLLPAGDNHYSRRTPEKLARGEKHGNAKVTDAQREEIRQRRTQGEPLIELGIAYGLHYSTISDITKDIKVPRRRRWKKRPIT